MALTVPLTLKLQNGCITYFISVAATAEFQEVADNLATVINASGGFQKNLKPTPMNEEQLNDIEIPKPSFGVDSSDEEDQDGDEEVGNTTEVTQENGTDIGGIEVSPDQLKFAISKTKQVNLDSLVAIEDLQATVKSYDIGDYAVVLFALKDDEFDVIEPVLDPIEG